MTSVRKRGEQIRRFILANVESHPDSITNHTAKKFGVSRQAVNKHLARLVDEKALSREGTTRNRRYALVPLIEWSASYKLPETREEHTVWRDHIQPRLSPLPDNAMGIWSHGFTEMFNNAIDHSNGKMVSVKIKRTAVSTSMLLVDDGIGIFKKIMLEFGLDDERHAVLELSKGKLTTDPKKHTGEGIFFTSRMFDNFAILSGDTYFSHEFGEREDWLMETETHKPATAVHMKLNNHTSRTVEKVYSKFAASDDDFSFSRTVVPVRMAKFGDEFLVSRSQAKRMLARVHRFSVVVFDFRGVREIGQAFADEVFRVFANNHPEIQLEWIYANSAVKRMILRAISLKDDAMGQQKLFDD